MEVKLSRVCLFCYKNSDSGNNDFNVEEKAENINRLVGRFHNNLERFTSPCCTEQESTTDDSISTSGNWTKWIGCCKLCWVIVDAFCEEFHQMKCLEMRMEWKLKRIVGIMELAGRVPSRWFKLQHAFGQSQHSLDDLKYFRQKIIKRCQSRLSVCQPRVVLNKNFNAHKFRKRADIIISASSDAECKPPLKLVMNDIVKVERENNFCDLDRDKLETVMDQLNPSADKQLEEMGSQDIAIVTVKAETTHSADPDLQNFQEIFSEPHERGISSSETGQYSLRDKQRISYSQTSDEEDNGSELSDVDDYEQNVESDSKDNSSDESVHSTNSDENPDIKPRVEIKVICSSGDSNNHFRCKVCFKTFTKKRKLQGHIRNVHRIYRCTECEEEFRTQFAKRKHATLVHNRQDLTPKLECSTCGKKFFRKFHLENHNLTAHNIGNPVPCELCGKTFQSEMRMKIHVKRVHGDSLYKCSLCPKLFKTKEGLVAHKKSRHEGKVLPRTKFSGKRYTKRCLCTDCGKMCGSTSDLRKHMAVHYKGPPLVCKYCAGTYPHPLALKKHVKGQHPGKMEKETTDSKQDDNS